MKQLRVLFVAGFNNGSRLMTGGQATVATNILQSELGRRVEFIPLDTSMPTSNPCFFRCAVNAACAWSRLSGSFVQPMSYFYSVPME